MNAFAALADPRRQDIIRLLAKNGEMSSSDIVNSFDVSAPAISQHLRILRSHQLVSVKKDAQRRLYSINPDGLDEISKYIDEVRRVWKHASTGLRAI